MTQRRIQFYRGLESNYISKYERKGNGADVAFKTKYLNGVYFAKDTGVIYVNGKRYGFCNSLDVNAFTDVLYTVPSNTTNPKLTFKDSNGEVITEITLFRMYSGTPNYLEVDLDENNNYKISLNLKSALKQTKIKDSSNVIIADDNDEGAQIGVYLGIEHDTQNKKLNFVSYDVEGNPNVFGSVDEGDYLKNTFLRSVEKTTKVVDETSVDVLRFTWNDDITNKGLTPTILDIPISDIIGEVQNYTINKKSISSNPILKGGDISVGDIASDESWEPNEDGIYEVTFKTSDSIALALKKFDERLKAPEGVVSGLVDDVTKLKEDVGDLQLVSNITVQGETNGDFVSNVNNNDETNVITVTKGIIAQANLTGYETEQGIFTSQQTINSAIQNLDESLTWK